MTDLKIADKSWTDQSESELDSMSTSAALVVSDPGLYPDVVAEATALTSSSKAYHIIYSRYASFGGSDLRIELDAAKDTLYTDHFNLARKLELTANGSKEYLIRPGYRLVEEDRIGRHSLATVRPPVIQKLENTKQRGRVKFILKAQNSREIKAIVGRSSTDNGVTWQNGILELNLRFLLENQPSGQGVLYQFMFKATNGRTSDWSDAVHIDVY